METITCPLTQTEFIANHREDFNPLDEFMALRFTAAGVPPSA
jgi:hypothetical protein